MVRQRGSFTNRTQRREKTLSLAITSASVFSGLNFRPRESFSGRDLRADLSRPRAARRGCRGTALRSVGAGTPGAADAGRPAVELTSGRGAGGRGGQSTG